MFKFNFDNSEESKREEEEIINENGGELIKESKCIKVSSDRYKQIVENFPNFHFEVFVSNEVEIGFISLVDNRSSDLIAGEYEGGFKIWECTQDLVDYFTKANSENEFDRKRICDLGCAGEFLKINK